MCLYVLITERQCGTGVADVSTAVIKLREIAQFITVAIVQMIRSRVILPTNPWGFGGAAAILGTVYVVLARTAGAVSTNPAIKGTVYVVLARTAGAISTKTILLWHRGAKLKGLLDLKRPGPKLISDFLIIGDGLVLALDLVADVIGGGWGSIDWDRF
jgi:hypothetical protein